MRFFYLEGCFIKYLVRLLQKHGRIYCRSPRRRQGRKSSLVEQVIIKMLKIGYTPINAP